MGSMRTAVYLGLILIVSALVYIMGTLGDDPIRGPDPRICPDTLEIAGDEEIIEAALGLAAAESQTGEAPYASAAALKADDPYIRFSSDWHWQRWQTDRGFRMGLRNAGLQYAYTVLIAYRKWPGSDKPYAIEAYRLGPCARPIGTGQPVSSGAWSVTTYERARSAPVAGTSS